MGPAMNEVMTTINISKSLAALSLVLSSTLACDVPDKQIGQLDDGTTGVEFCEPGPDCMETDVPPASCSDAEEFLISAFEESEDERCALLISFDYETFEPLGWNFSCGPGDLGLTEEEASALTTWGGVDISEPEGAEDDDRSFIFYTVPVDGGGVGWVSNHAGLLFDATIEWNGNGAIHYPSEFADPSELGTGCPDLNQGFETRGYDLSTGAIPTTWALPEGHTEALLDSLQNTAVMRVVQHTFHSQVWIDILAYPRTLGGFDPSTAEYIMVIEPWD